MTEHIMDLTCGLCGAAISKEEAEFYGGHICANCGDNIPCHCRKPGGEERAWLVERKGSCGLSLGYSSICGKLEWATSATAIRFARKDDADAFIKLMDLNAVEAVEHIWS